MLLLLRPLLGLLLLLLRRLLTLLRLLLLGLLRLLLPIVHVANRTLVVGKRRLAWPSNVCLETREDKHQRKMSVIDVSRRDEASDNHVDQDEDKDMRSARRKEARGKTPNDRMNRMRALTEVEALTLSNPEGQPQALTCPLGTLLLFALLGLLLAN